MENMNAAYAISPIDGRYSEKTASLKFVFSEFALMKSRVLVEVEYLIAIISLLYHEGDKYVKSLSAEQEETLRGFYKNFSDEDFESIKKFENSTKHDVKAVEYFLRNKLINNGMQAYVTYVHLGRTSEDINNFAYAIMLCRGASSLRYKYEEVAAKLSALAYAGQNIPMLARTHGQPATPSTVGWAVNVTKQRMLTSLKKFNDFKMRVKFNGATGGDNALLSAYPKICWSDFNKSFIDGFNENQFISFDLEANPYTLQIEPHDTYKELFEIFTGLNSILIDFCMNMWMYISQEHYVQKAIKGEVGSSAMPQKVNPIDFENAEGNLAFANAIFEFFSRRLPISRGYRDLTDSTIERNFGIAFAHSLVAVESIQKGLNKLLINQKFLRDELDNHWETITEGYQVILRSVGVEKGYEALLEKVRGKKVTKEMLHEFIDNKAEEYGLDSGTIEKLKSLTPHNYLGNRSQSID